MERRGGVLVAALAALIAGVLVLRRRPVTPPVHAGNWEPIHR